jgi:hypothetical protein
LSRSALEAKRKEVYGVTYQVIPDADDGLNITPNRETVIAMTSTSISWNPVLGKVYTEERHFLQVLRGAWYR